MRNWWRAKRPAPVERPGVSVVVPLFNEAENVVPLVAEFEALAEQVGSLEVLLVDDGSSDGTWDHVRSAAESHDWLRGIRTEQNRGQSAATILGLAEAGGDQIVTMDGDLQNNPADIPRLLALLSECDVVCGYRARRRDSLSRRVGSRVANRVRNWITRDGIRDTGCALKAFRRACVADLPAVNGVHRFMPAYFRLHGRTIREVAVDHRPRRHGSSKYTNLKRLPRTVFDLFGFVWFRRRSISHLAPGEVLDTADG